MSKEYVIIGKENYKTESVVTGGDSISFSLADMEIAVAVKKFKTVTELSISGDDLKPYGIYSNLTFNAALVDDNGLVTVIYHIMQSVDKRLSELEKTQIEQDEAIAEIIGGDLDAE